MDKPDSSGVNLLQGQGPICGSPSWKHTHSSIRHHETNPLGKGIQHTPFVHFSHVHTRTYPPSSSRPATSESDKSPEVGEFQGSVFFPPVGL